MTGAPAIEARTFYFTVAGKEFKVLAGSLYSAYELWCDENGEKSVSQRALGQELESRGFEAARTKTGRYRKGLGLISADDAMTSDDALSGSFSRRGYMGKEPETASSYVIGAHASSGALPI